MVIYYFGAAILIFIFGVGAVQLWLYVIRWYELSNRSFNLEITISKAIQNNRFKAIRVFLWEWGYSLIYIALYLPAILTAILGKKRIEFEPGELVKGKPLIILIHGLFGKHTHFWFMRRRFARKSIPNVLTFEYESLKESIDDNCLALRDFMLRIKAKTGMSEAIFVGHSLGGIIAHEYVRKYGEDGAVTSVVALGSPFRGTRLAALGSTLKARSLHPSNPIFGEMISSNLNTRFLSLYSRYDQFVLPYTNSEHPGAGKNIEIDLCGHTGFFFRRAVFKIIMDWIEESGYSRPNQAKK